MHVARLYSLVLFALLTLPTAPGFGQFLSCDTLCRERKEFYFYGPGTAIRFTYDDCNLCVNGIGCQMGYLDSKTNGSCLTIPNAPQSVRFVSATPLCPDNQDDPGGWVEALAYGDAGSPQTAIRKECVTSE